MLVIFGCWGELSAEGGTLHRGHMHGVPGRGLCTRGDYMGEGGRGDYLLELIEGFMAAMLEG